MAVTLINAVADIPASPTAGDIIRFGTAITSGIPSSVKKANGTTTETAILVGSEYRYIGTNWLRIGGDPIQSSPLKDASTLADGEFETAILGAVSNGLNSGRIRKFGFEKAQQALQAENPIQIDIEGTEILQRAYGSEIEGSSLSPGSTVNLDIREGTTRHSFADGYFGYLFIFVNHRTNNASKSIYRVFMMQEEIDISYPPNYSENSGLIGPITSTNNFAIRKINNTSFKFFGGDTLQKIIGYKLELSLQTP